MFSTSIKSAAGRAVSLFRVDAGAPQPSALSADEPGQDHTAGSAPLPHSPDCISILLVDDEPLLNGSTKQYLEKKPGIRVTVAGSAEEALAAFAAGTFDIIVSDYQMPGMDGIGLLNEIRARSRHQPFILFTGKCREDVVIDALNSGADFFVRKDGVPATQFADLLQKIRRVVRQRRADAALKKKHELLRALLVSSPNGIAFVRNRTLQWVNEPMGSMLGYSRAEMKGMDLARLYGDRRTCEQTGNRIRSDLRKTGTSRVITKFRHKNGSSIDAEIHIAPLNRGNLHLGHIINLTEISGKVPVAANAQTPAPIPHLELTPVIELDRNGNIIYYNDASITAMGRYGSRGTLEEFFPADLREILGRMDEPGAGSVHRDVRIGAAVFRLHITLSQEFQVARLSAIEITDANRRTRL